MSSSIPTCQSMEGCPIDGSPKKAACSVDGLAQWRQYQRIAVSGDVRCLAFSEPHNLPKISQHHSNHHSFAKTIDALDKRSQKQLHWALLLATSCNPALNGNWSDCLWPDTKYFVVCQHWLAKKPSQEGFIGVQTIFDPRPLMPKG